MHTANIIRSRRCFSFVLIFSLCVVIRDLIFSAFKELYKI